MTLPIVAVGWAMIQVTILCLIVLVLAQLVRGRSPQIMTSLLSGACVGCLALAASIFLPATHWSMALTIPKHSQLETKTAASAFETQRASDAQAGIANANASGNEQLTELSPKLQTSLVAFRIWAARQLQGIEYKMRTADMAHSRSARFWTRCSACVLAGCGAMWTVWFYSFLYARRLVKSSCLIEDKGLNQIAMRLAREMGLQKTPGLRASASIPVGATVGFRPCLILLNPDWVQWSERELRAVLAHELAHVVRGDYLWVIVGAWIRVIFVFHPLVHCVVRRLRLEQELAADQLAAARMDHAIAYGRALASLTLRCQQHFRAPSPMLAAEQICVTRRIEMLKQGRLKPKMSRSRWCGVLTIVATLIALPLSGLRGTPPEPLPQQEAVADSVSDDGTSDAGLAEAKLARETYKKLEFVGNLIYRPKRGIPAHASQTFLWSNTIAQTMLFGKESNEDPILRGTCTASSGWRDMKKMHGDLTFGGSLNSGQNTEPGLLSELFQQPAFGPGKKVDEKQIDGHQVIGIGFNGSKSTTANSWIVDDKSGFVSGSEEDVRRHIAGHRDEFKNVPAEFVQETTHSLLALIWDDCPTWNDRIAEHFQGSPHQQFVDLVNPLFSGLERIGVFVRDVEESTTLVRLRFVDEASCVQAKLALDGLVALCTVAIHAMPSDDNPELRSLLSKLSIQVAGPEIHIGLDLTTTETLIAAVFADNVMNDDRLQGWSNLFDSFELEQGPESNEPWLKSSGSVVAFPCLISQSIQATSWRGQRIQLQAQFQAPENHQSTAGAILWASDATGMSLGYRSDSIDGSCGIESTIHYTAPAQVDASDLQSASWKNVTLEMNVPENAEIISLGMYAKAEGVKIRKVSVRKVDANSPAVDERATIQFSRNLLMVPTQKVLSQVTNLNFSSENSDPQETNVAEVPEAKVAR